MRGFKFSLQHPKLIELSHHLLEGSAIRLDLNQSELGHPIIDQYATVDDDG